MAGRSQGVFIVERRVANLHEHIPGRQFASASLSDSSPNVAVVALRYQKTAHRVRNRHTFDAHSLKKQPFNCRTGENLAESPLIDMVLAISIIRSQGNILTFIQPSAASWQPMATNMRGFRNG
jgi:hypothetical protein